MVSKRKRQEWARFELINSHTATPAEPSTRNVRSVTYTRRPKGRVGMQCVNSEFTISEEDAAALQELADSSSPVNTLLDFETCVQKELAESPIGDGSESVGTGKSKKNKVRANI